MGPNPNPPIANRATVRGTDGDSTAAMMATPAKAELTMAIATASKRSATAA